MMCFTCGLRDRLISMLPNVTAGPFEVRSVTKRDIAREELWPLTESAAATTGHMSGIFYCSGNSDVRELTNTLKQRETMSACSVKFCRLLVCFN
jgi:hypothetical protein